MFEQYGRLEDQKCGIAHASPKAMDTLGVDSTGLRLQKAFWLLGVDEEKLDRQRSEALSKLEHQRLMSDDPNTSSSYLASTRCCI